MSQAELNEDVRQFWEQKPCGTDREFTGPVLPGSRAWFERVEEHRYAVEPFIHSVAQFSRHSGKRVLEIGVGAGTDHLQFARAGAQCFGVDLTDAAIETTRAHLAHHGLKSNLQRIDAESLPFSDGFFDVVYSWGVIHHSQQPERIISEVHRVLRPGGVFLGMLYNRRSAVSVRLWCQYALVKLRPWRSFADVIAKHVESQGTRAYTKRELEALFARFKTLKIRTFFTSYDLTDWTPIGRLFPESWGWFHGIKAVR